MSHHMQYRPPKHKTCDGLSCTLGILGVLVFASAVALLIDGFIFARPGIPALSYRETECRVVRFKFIELRPCECGGFQDDDPNCKSSFPCVQVHVQYETATYNGTTMTTSLIHEHESVSYSSNSDCSLQSCVREKRGNRHKIEGFLRDYGKVGSNYTCFYDSENPQTVIVERQYTPVVIIISLAIPGGVFIVSALALAILCVKTRKSKTKEPPRPPSHRPYMIHGYRTSNQQRSTSPGGHDNETYTREEDPSPPHVTDGV